MVNSNLDFIPIYKTYQPNSNHVYFYFQDEYKMNIKTEFIKIVF